MTIVPVKFCLSELGKQSFAVGPPTGYLQPIRAVLSLHANLRVPKSVVERQQNIKKVHS